MALDPSLHLCSNITANLRTSGFIGSGSEALFWSYGDPFFRNSLAKIPKIISAVIPLVNNS
jgi:hypothetical protein